MSGCSLRIVGKMSAEPQVLQVAVAALLNGERKMVRQPKQTIWMSGSLLSTFGSQSPDP
jgi:hypothetical protein